MAITYNRLNKYNSTTTYWKLSSHKRIYINQDITVLEYFGYVNEQAFLDGAEPIDTFVFQTEENFTITEEACDTRVQAYFNTLP